MALLIQCEFICTFPYALAKCEEKKPLNLWKSLVLKGPSKNEHTSKFAIYLYAEKRVFLLRSATKEIIKQVHKTQLRT